jgi:hypothetical protein
LARSNRELWLALAAVLTISAGYLAVVLRLGSIPGASEFFGHSLGILGFLLMLMTETLYSLRKRSRSARWGRMASWLQFHIFTGLVGPYLVLLHSSWKFNGLAGVLMLLTVIIVLSGFIGRYIYTAVPRSAEGTALAAETLDAEILAVERAFNRLLADHPDAAAFVESSTVGTYRQYGDLRLLLGRAFDDSADRVRWWLAARALPPGVRRQSSQLARLQLQRRNLARQVASLAVARRTLALWHAVHIPIGMALFTVAFVHIGAAVYYATLLK